MNQLLIFTRYPKPGTTKTRLIPALGAKKAAQLQKRLTEHVIQEATSFATTHEVNCTVYYSGGTQQEVENWLHPLACVQQIEGNIGLKMKTAFNDTFANKSEFVVLVGSDIPDITSDIFSLAFEALQENELVIGPASDGGYYLVGMSQSLAPQLLSTLFDDMEWSTQDVLKETATRLQRSYITFVTLPRLHDIDIPADLVYVQQKGWL